MSDLIKSKLYEVLKSIVPLITVILAFQYTMINISTELFIQFIIGATMTIGGLVLFFLGIDVGVLPMGKFIGAQLPKKNSLFIIAAVAFAVSFATTVAEPDVLVLAKQVKEISGGMISGNAVTYLMAIGVGLFAMIAMFRIIIGFSMVRLLTVFYVLVILFSLFAPTKFVALAYDAGSVTTGALTAPVLLALALGLSSVLANRTSLSDGFGILGFASIGPIIIILLMGALFY